MSKRKVRLSMELAEYASPTESELGIPGRASHLVSDELLSVLAVIPHLCLSMLNASLSPSLPSLQDICRVGSRLEGSEEFCSLAPASNHAA